MGLTAGARIGPYEIVSLIGAGGMGEVYRARDTRLGRDVAIKVLPEAFANDAERLARFQREAQLLASLNHRHIAIIHGLEESGGSRALVMELVEGPTLADRIAEGPIPIDEALPIARQIAEALEAAHERGVIHRDLKPANIKITPNGTVKVLDFGLAKLAEPDAAAAGGLTMSPTLSVQATVAGVILGTAAYMSPEQARGKRVDIRTDIWAFGCVLFEMLTGTRAFDAGETISDAVAAILKNDPDWTRLPAEAPPSIRTLLRRCLQKDPSKRLPHIGVARLEIDEGPTASETSATAGGLQEGTAVLARAQRHAMRAWSVAAVATIAVLVLAVPAMRHVREAPPPARPEMRTEIVTPATTDSISMALSPDGRQIVFAASSEGSSRLWLRPIASSAAQPLAGTEGATHPFWSPDGRSIGFFAGGALMRLDIGGGSPRVLARVGTSRGGTWNADGVILFPTSAISPLYRVSASGGEPASVTRLDRQNGHRFPTFLPDGRRFLYYEFGSPDTQGIYIGSLDSAQVKRLTSADTAGVFAPGGWVLWVRGTALVAQRLDLDREELVGSQVTVADPVGFDSTISAGAVSSSASGLIAYRVSGASRRQLIWFDRAGKTVGNVGPSDDAGLSSPRLSPDDRRVVAYRTLQGNADIWMLDGSRISRFTFDAALDRYPIWSADGSRIVFDSNRKGTRNLYVKPSSGAGSEELLLESSENKAANHWSKDGRFFVYTINSPKTGWDVWIVSLEGERKPWRFLETNFNERAGQFSPDGRWMAYQSDESGRYEVYVRPFVASDGAGSGANQVGGQWQVSTAGGIFARWRADGQELFYVAPDGRMMAVPTGVTEGALVPGTPVALFSSPMYGGGASPDLGRQYDVSRDGRFLINTVVDETAAPITILQNWNPEGR